MSGTAGRSRKEQTRQHSRADTRGAPDMSTATSTGTAPPWALLLCDVLAGFTLLAWAVGFGIEAVRQPNWIMPTMAVFQAWVGVLLLLRLRVTTPARWSDIALTTPSLLFSGVALKLAADPSKWPGWDIVLFMAGAAVALVSLGWLGRSFAIFPAARPLVAGGPYRLVRHPAYFGEFLMILACVLASDPWALLLLPITAAALVVRIRLEEAALSRESEYQRYAEAVRWCLLPGVW
jgi:protein-S-isoprenylcysteine O-methyltransferase Ste14